MKTSTSLTFIFLGFLITQLSFVQSDANIIAQTCKQTPYYNLCVSSLSSDPASSRADVRGLALIMINMVKAKATISVQLINQLFKKSPRLKNPLSFCAESYSAILSADIPEALEALQKGVPKFAQNGANDAANEANLCEANFHGKSPLTKFNKIVHDTSVIASAIIQQLL
ncbi:cell wall / vacuolar inhibitor of fructosidase 1 [Manihot esculenta]|uniref:Invertase inhibitor n=1 Tax=Manihot esculenta TaxID=3983 RepID=A0A0B5KUF3_MANES|nr:cell wall / vacuolar inhibitor of fructosidase 1 [Manihot esculenta]AJG39412.1 invertase inhibitor [Manihot esculenta]OAY56159.1 hypothetical protein MANES_03G207100v8 [Manihot esculenta]